MDYNEQIRELKAFFGLYCIREPNAADKMVDAAKSIEDLVKRAEEAEARCKILETRLETAEKMVKEYQDELIPGYRDWAEKAERERDAAVSDISKILGEIDETTQKIEPEDIYDALSLMCRGYCSQSGNKCYSVENGYECKNFKWRGAKED